MPRKEKKQTKVEGAIEYAAVAQNIAGAAMTSVYAQGAILQALINTLCDNSILPQEKLPHVFLGAAAMVDGMEIKAEAQLAGQHAMRTLISQIAQGYGIGLPPPGETGIQRRP
jgi:hypothetical protein